MIAEVCWPCVCGLHDECFDPSLINTQEIDDELEVGETAVGLLLVGLWAICCCHKHKNDDAAAFVSEGKQPVGRPLSNPEDITDIRSTGRKRAAALYIITDGMLCEWSGLQFAGGGVEPIVGCDGHTISNTKSGAHAGHRHHGPDKNTLNNSPGNVHRICTQCHNRWHAANNAFYSSERPAVTEPWVPEIDWTAHDAVTLADPDELEDTNPETRVDVED